jgi:7-cyano-7-deazaguanine synthase
VSRLAVVLLSGGLDSTTVAALARSEGYRLLALTIDYNQRHRIELEHATRVAAAVGAERHIVLPLDLRGFGGSALTADIDVPKSGVEPGIPVTYVPARNTIFLSVARSITRAIPIAGPSSSQRSKPWQTAPPRPASRAMPSASTPRSAP